MTQVNIEMLRALEMAGVPKEQAQAAATSVAVAADVATKAELAQLEVRQTWRLVGAVAVLLVVGSWATGWLTSQLPG